jgi:hypothetical protein
MRSVTAPRVCVTVDVEDFYEGMAVLGQQLARPEHHTGGLESLLERLEASPGSPRITLFVVGRYAPAVRGALAAFVAAGHEIASHGPDHGRLPADDTVGWLRRGRQALEDLVQVPVRGFRSPRFDVPAAGLARYREQLAEAGFRYVSDTARLGERSPVVELPVMTWRGVRLGGGSYQRLLPRAAVTSAVKRAADPVVLYYHSYDFDGSLPGLGAVRSPMLARQLVARGRIAPAAWSVVERLGSETCFDVAG